MGIALDSDPKVCGFKSQPYPGSCTFQSKWLTCSHVKTARLIRKSFRHTCLHMTDGYQWCADSGSFGPYAVLCPWLCAHPPRILNLHLSKKLADCVPYSHKSMSAHLCLSHYNLLTFYFEAAMALTHCMWFQISSSQEMTAGPIRKSFRHTCLHMADGYQRCADSGSFGPFAVLCPWSCSHPPRILNLHLTFYFEVAMALTHCIWFQISK